MESWGRVESGWWEYAADRGLSAVATALGPYLFTCRHRTSIGVFRLTAAQIALELPRWSASQIEAALAELADAGPPTLTRPAPKPVIVRLESYIVVRDHLRHNGPRNDRAARAMVTKLAELPRPVRAIAARCALDSGSHVALPPGCHELRTALEEAVDADAAPDPEALEGISQVSGSVAHGEQHGFSPGAHREPSVSVSVSVPVSCPLSSVPNVPASPAARARDPSTPHTEQGAHPPLALVPTEPAAPALAAQVGQVWQHFRRYHPRSTVLDPKTRKAVEERLGEGYTVEQLCRAIDGQHATPHNLGANERGTKYLDLELAVRNGANVRRFGEAAEARAARAPPPTARDARNAAVLDAVFGEEER